MDPVSAAAQSIEAVNNILQAAHQASIETAEKMVKVSVEMSLSAELGKGSLVDLSG
jgi:hypothetical protein